MQLYGIHGTCRSSGDKIQQNGFNKGQGRHGVGVYLWASSIADQNLNDMAIKLAECFVDHGRIKNWYRSANDDSTYILGCELDLDEDDFLDMEDYRINNMFKAYAIKQIKQQKPSKNDFEAKRNAGIIYAAFIELIEKLRKAPIKAIHVQTKVPPHYVSFNGTEVEWLGLHKASCYVVRDITCITSMQRIV